MKLIQHILLAFNNPELEQEVRTYIYATYEVKVLEGRVSPAQMPAVCVFDLENWDNVMDWTSDLDNAEVYRLLILSTEELANTPLNITDQVDDILTLPLQPTELNIRLRSLFRIKNHIHHQQVFYEKLATTRRALDSTSDGVIIADKTGVALYVNPAFIKLFGYTINELNNGGIPAILFQKAAMGEQVFDLARNNGSWKTEVELKTKSGQNLVFLLNIDAIVDNKQQIIGFITICTDMTQQQELLMIREEQHKLVQVELDTLRALANTLDLDEVFERILKNISEVVPSDAANIILIQDGKVELVGCNDYSDYAALEELKSGEYEAIYFDDLRKMLETGEPLVISNTNQYLSKHQNMQVRTPWLNSHIGMPIRLQNEINGFLNVDSIQAGLFTAHHAVRLQLFAEQAAIAIHNARTNEQAKKAAMLEERQRLARNLHDAVSQTLFSANIIAENLPLLWETDPEEVLPRLEQIRTLNRGALAEMRTLLLELHPERLLETKISVLLQQLVEGILGQTYLNVHLEVNQDLALPSSLHEAVYYITQEALNNVAKHADANRVDIELIKHNKELNLMITDNGRGFDPNQTTPKNFGLDNIRERAESTNAHLKITSELGQGTQISVNWTI